MGLSGSRKGADRALARKIAREDFDVYFEDARERLGHAVGLAQSAIRSLILVNGGAIVSLLTLVGNSNIKVEELALFWAFGWFGAGLFTSLLSAISASVSQISYMMSSVEEGWRAQAESHGKQYDRDGMKDDKVGDTLTLAALVCALASLTFFVVGAFVALDAIT